MISIGRHHFGQGNRIGPFYDHWTFEGKRGTVHFRALGSLIWMSLPRR